jgi:hypothetical protein
MFEFPIPDQQIGFSLALAQARGLYLQNALGETVESLDIAQLDTELAKFAPAKMLAALARHGLRGELVFVAPSVLSANPRLLGYYRLLLGYSQKEFYTVATGASSLKALEASGKLSPKAALQLPGFCAALNKAAAALVEGIGPNAISRALLDDLTLLTFGPQLRGGANVRRGGDATLRVFKLIQGIVKKAVVKLEGNSIEVKNAARRTVLIEFAADPDLIIRERMTKGGYRNIIAIEIKGGTDFSNIHNRLGEAEKSHQKARANGFTECWTVVNVNRFDARKAAQESPSTDRFYQIAQLEDEKSEAFQDFRERIVSLTGIKD